MIRSGFSPFKAWKIALCSLSIGMILVLVRSASFKTSSPAITSVSLLASARFLPDLKAARAGSSPALPTTPETTRSASEKEATQTAPSEPETISTSKSATNSFRVSILLTSFSEASAGLNLRICWANNSTLLPADIAETLKFSGLRSTTSSVLTPMEPVEPSKDIFLMKVS